MQEESERRVNLASLVPENAIDAALRIWSIEGWSKVEQLGQGAYGEVWKYATNINETPVVAGKHLKVQLWNLSKDQKVDLQTRVHDFIRELNNLYKVSRECSERFVQFIGCYVDNKKLILFTELMNGSIKDYIIDKPLEEATALKYTFQATQGLHFLHHYKEGRIVHRDIKCENLLLTSKFDVKLADFGLAYNLAVDNESYTMAQSAPCGFAGTVAFAAPEVLAGNKYGRRADIWSLGCALVEMLTSEPPHSDFWRKHKERARFLFIQQAQAAPEQQLPYVGQQLVPSASPSVHKLLDCLFVKNEAHRPRSKDIIRVFAFDALAPTPCTIIPERLDELKLRIGEAEETSSNITSFSGTHSASNTPYASSNLSTSSSTSTLMDS